ncbi:MAG: nucleotidyl transferase AbiEii/AbiGii toxin family protein [Pseudohongiellaceae bacterium]
MPFGEMYQKQTALLVRMLPYIAKESRFAIKGGTAINLFIRNLPRLSVDIDLTWLPLAGRKESLIEIEKALKRIAADIEQTERKIRVTATAPKTQNQINKIVVHTDERIRIKIEVSPVLRGCVFDSILMPVCDYVRSDFGFSENKILSFADIYAGKIVAALSRQHPRDFFDIHYLFQQEGITNEVRTAFIVYLISSNKAPHSLLAPRLQDISYDFEHGFVGMPQDNIALSQLLSARKRLVNDIVNNMPQSYKEFLRSFYMRKPDWNLLGLDDVQNLPAVKWREVNLDGAGKGTCEGIVRNLDKVLRVSR